MRAEEVGVAKDESEAGLFGSGVEGGGEVMGIRDADGEDSKDDLRMAVGAMAAGDEEAGVDEAEASEDDDDEEDGEEAKMEEEG